MIISTCLCSKKTKACFQITIRYQNETTFQAYNGLVIGQCNHCGLLKTINDSHNSNNNEPISDSHHYETNLKNLSFFFKPLIEKIKQFKPSGSVLDVGCSTGILLSLLQKDGFKTYGIEPNKKAYTLANKKLGKNIFYGVLSTFVKTHKQQYDCIIYNHTLEHIKNIHKELSIVKTILKQDGLFILGVPNTANIIFYIRKKFWESLLPNQHIWHFNTHYLTKLLQQYGLQTLNVSFTDHTRTDYPFIKKIYFSFLTLLNKLMNTGEAVLLIAKNNKPI